MVAVREYRAMSFVIYLFSILTLLGGTVIVIKPAPVFDFIAIHSTSLTVHLLAVLIRGVVGLALLFCSPAAKFPTTFLVIGWASLASALVMLLVGRTRFKTLIAWAVNVPPLFKRLGGLLAILFGSFLLSGMV